MFGISLRDYKKGEKYIKVSETKRMVIYFQKPENYSPPPLSPKNYPPYSPKKDGYIFWELIKIKTPPMFPQNGCPISLGVCFLIRRGRGNPSEIVTYPPIPL